MEIQSAGQSRTEGDGPLIELKGIRTPPGTGEDALWARTAAVLGERPRSLRPLRRSLDARKDPVLVWTVAVEVRDERAVLRRVRGASRRTDPAPYRPPGPVPKPVIPPVVVGAGPAGLAAARVLSMAGAPPVLLERGRPVEERQADVSRFRDGGALDPESNAQFGEGGAGAFSDGKLSTGTRDPRHRAILERLVACGAPPDLLIDARPHIGTDLLRRILPAYREDLAALGTDLRFRHRLTDLSIEGGVLTGIAVEGPEGPYRMPCRHLILCPGHSARDTFALLRRRGVPMEAKPFAVGARIEHRQADIDAAQYRAWAGRLPPSSYKLVRHLPGGRSVFTFCVCPGGEVIAAASETGGVVTNGMSPYARDGINICGGLLVGVSPSDFGGGPGDPLAGIAFQRRLEAAAYELGAAAGPYCAPVQLVGDLLSGRASTGPGRVLPTYRPGVAWTDLRRCLPPFVSDALAEALPLLGRDLRGFDAPDAVLTAVESRSSSPVRILRDRETYQSAVRGLWPCGEGGGWAGGILSAAADGMRCAEQVCVQIGKEGRDP